MAVLSLTHPQISGCSFDPGLLRQCREPGLWLIGIPADSCGSRMALVAKKTNRVAPVCAWEGEKIPCGSAEVSFMWHRLQSDEQLGTQVLALSCGVPELQPRGRTCPRLIPSAPGEGCTSRALLIFGLKHVRVFSCSGQKIKGIC